MVPMDPLCYVRPGCVLYVFIWSMPTNPDGFSLDTTNLGSRDGEKTDTMTKRTLKTNIIKNA